MPSCAASSSSAPAATIAGRQTPGTKALTPFELLFEARAGRAVALPPRLHRIYGGDLRFGARSLYANFVSSIDGVVAVEDRPSSGSLISGKSDSDRFLMGLLRAVADVVLIGAGTLRATPGHRWTAAHVFPALATDFEIVRRSTNRAADPLLVVLSASGDLPGSHPALEAGALVLTTADGARRAHGRLPSACEVVVLGRGKEVPMADAIRLIRARGSASVLSEAGGVVTGQLVRDQLVDELYLTVSPVLAGRVRGDRNKGIVEGIHLLPDVLRPMRLVSARRHQSHLFLRYRRA
jgi:riboflavin biosynthesis pyrimidine reductase